MNVSSVTFDFIEVSQVVNPLLHCFVPAVHYRAWTKSTLHKFEDTWHEQQPLELVIGKGAKGFAIVFSIWHI